MAWEGKKYKLDRQENFEEYMKKIGVGMVLRKMGMSVHPTVYLVKDGDEYSFHTDSTFKNTVMKFKLGEEFENETLDGRKVQTVITLDGNTMTQVEKGEKKSVIVREFSDSEVVVTCEYDGVVSKRWYKVV
ncbi:hypothetical protein PVAND_010223 [Polypedilum vanderplanki]|uniref:Fatty acid-binding protein, muscle n=1 Tax=Polypedilum vanderplanki TaxID=319348 RepID=A0A9J6CFL6_POLVA|nr:hypothetical protein PVAND_010223 [Polypedilum vanderplanki]